MEELTEKLETYFRNSKTEFSFGMQNFQGIREYIKIPLAQLTLLYGQNSAGKSTVHDVQQFIHNFFSGKWDEKTTEEYLERWANHNRVPDQITKGYLGNSDDVVISIDYATGQLDYFNWEGTYQHNQDFITDDLASTIFASGGDRVIPFRAYFNFSNNSKDSSWCIRQFSLYLGDDHCLDLDFFEGILRINKSHLVYSLVDSWFEGGAEKLVNELMGENSHDLNYLVLRNLDTNSELAWKKPISWVEYDNSDNRPTPEVLELRTFLLSMLIIPTQSIGCDFEFASIPPLRPIPTKQSAVFRCKLEDYTNSNGWLALAEQVCMMLIDKQYPVDQPHRNELSFEQLDELNLILSHPMFLNTDYELTGDCLFLGPIGAFSNLNTSNDEEMRETLRHFEAEIHLKLRHKGNGALIEIEDVGVGISQVIPVLISIIQNTQVFIQQPELHLHPKLQAQLADAFIKSINQRAWSRLVIESHSEHFLLRLLRRIRETHKSDIRHKLFGLSADQVSVLYVDKLEDGSSKIFPLRISADGEFIDRWPHGFFTERDGELFDE